MHITEHKPAPLSTGQIIKTVSLTAAEKKIVAEAISKETAMLEIIRVNMPDDGNGHQYLHLEMDRAGNSFEANPSAENAEAFTQAVSRWKIAEVVFPPLNETCHRHLNLCQTACESVALAVLGRAEDTLATESAKVRAGLVSAEKVFGSNEELAAFDSRLIATAAALADERGEVRRAPLQWLRNHGIA